jgi:hypothetical protein
MRRHVAPFAPGRSWVEVSAQSHLRTAGVLHREVLQCGSNSSGDSLCCTPQAVTQQHPLMNCTLHM